ncbi:MAG: hypothetical protein WKF83_00760 [Nocardioidaceae bacterium]
MPTRSPTARSWSSASTRPTAEAGHGSRLLQACADTMRADQFTRAVWWLPTTGDALREFVTGTGWSADGAHRELDLHGDGRVRLKQVRLHSALTEPPADVDA